MNPHQSVQDVVSVRQAVSAREAVIGAPGPQAALSPVVLEARPPAAGRAETVGRYTMVDEILKDVGDRLLAALGLIALSPIMLAVAIAIRLDSPGPALFRQTRIGRGGRRFTFYKFRGMHVDAEERFPELSAYRFTDEQLRDFHFHIVDDPRVTRVGRFIRRTSLDELPNLINVLKGDMSLVGPRPEIPEMIPYYGEVAGEVLSVKPGVTCLAIVAGRDDLSFSESLAMNLAYVRSRSLAQDMRILFGTVAQVATGRSAGH